MADRPDFHVITGGPGSGKTTLIDMLASQGFHHMPEAGRAIIATRLRSAARPCVGPIALFIP
jgi:predicted ATPase